MDLIPLSKLDQSDDNVCKTPNPEFEERLSHDIEARGVLQNLIVTKSSKRGRYEVIAGGKRMRAMHMIVERGAMQPDFEVQCLVIDKKVHNASEISLAENFQRLAMTPAEECRAFQHFIKEDGDTAAVAKRFGLTRRFVEGRLRLANLAEPIFEKLAAGELTLEIAKAYAATDQHEVQLRVFEQFRHSYYANADAIRRAIADGSMRGNDPIALLVGEEAYIAAGGKIERDLFSDSADDRWIDIPIAHELAAAKMEAEAERLASETGLAWINPVASTSSWHARNEMNLNVVRLPAAPITEEARKRIDEIDARTDEINEIFDKQEHDPDDDFDEDALETEFSKLEDERDELSNPTRELPEEWKPEVGRFLILTNTGDMILDSDYFSEKYLSFEQDDEGNLTGGFTESKPASPSRPAAPSSTEAEAPGGAKPISAKLFDELSVQRRNILSASLLGNPGLALDYAIFALADTKSYESKGTTIKGGKPHDPVNGDIPTSSAEAIIAQAYDDLDKGWTEHRDLVERFNAFRALGDDAKATWLAYVVAISLEAKKGYQSEYQPIHAVLGNLLDIDVASMWRPTSENFFDRIPKGACLAALTEVGGSELAARYSASKKADLSMTCEKLFSGDAIVEEEVKERAVTWLPKAMTFDLPVVADDDTADNEFDDDEFDGEAADGEIEGENATDVDEPAEAATEEPETAEEAEVDA
ncbi:ParB/RepB/Spo0J family partition protein [Croceicoccus mobilis]|uniref:Chromosome partitioning protein ParB n=1 Tax=Croceicoccus mobilis TaxID=1703339 RepID=A0A916ZA21_9SPHN|nr:ParB/RepB/Spo0J family partition protein [Croceicoccus mobilis]GGD82286.1 chromosome partitioning protein ParB [Croceicoccus mobilis]